MILPRDLYGSPRRLAAVRRPCPHDLPLMRGNEWANNTIRRFNRADCESCRLHTRHALTAVAWSAAVVVFVAALLLLLLGLADAARYTAGEVLQ